MQSVNLQFGEAELCVKCVSPYLQQKKFCLIFKIKIDLEILFLFCFFWFFF